MDNLNTAGKFELNKELNQPITSTMHKALSGPNQGVTDHDKK